MSGYLIKDTTKEEREQLVAESLGNISASCDGCSAGIVEIYQDYIDGKKELKDINMEFRAGYVSGNEKPDRLWNILNEQLFLKLPPKDIETSLNPAITVIF